MSGGVDSTVVFSLLSKALPGRVLGLFVDTGMMRHNEGGMVKTALEETFPGANLHFVNAEEQFLTALAGETAPEKKHTLLQITNKALFLSRASIPWLGEC